MRENLFRFLFVFCCFKGSNFFFFFITLEQLFNKRAICFFFCSEEKVSAADSVCLKGSEKANPNKRSASLIRGINWDFLSRLFLIEGKHAKLFTAAVICVHFLFI